MPDEPDVPTEPDRPDTELTHQLDRYLRHVAIERGRSHNTVSAYRRDLEGFLAYLTAQPGERSDVTTDTVTDYLRSLRERPSPLAATSLARTLSSIRGFARFLVDEGMLSSDPTAQSHPPKAPQRLPKALTIEQIAALLATSGGDEPTELRDAALLELLYATGARISEVVALNLDDIVGDDGTGVADMVRLFGKGGKQRIVPVGSYARSALDAYLVRARPVLSSRGRATPALFLGARGARLSRQNSWLIIRAAAERADLRVAVSPHTFRHSFATHLLQGGADVRVVQELLGHASVATTQIYTRVTADALRDVYVTAHPRARRADRGS